MAVKRISLMLILSMLGFSNFAVAQPWVIQDILEKVKAPSVRLMDKNKNVIDTVSMEHLRRLDSVSSRVAIAYGMPVPSLLLSKGQGLNAYVTVIKSGPVMVVMTDLLRNIGDDENLIAALVGHELGHLAANHPTGGASDMSVIRDLGQLIGSALESGNPGVGRQIGALGANLINAKYSRDQERMADDLGVRHMAIAGFDPSGAPRLMQLLNRASGGGGGNGVWTDSHPSLPERYQTLVATAKSLDSTYQTNRVNQSSELASSNKDEFETAVTRLMPGWRVLRESALFSLWLQQQPNATGDKLDSSNPADTVAVMTLFLTELPTLADAAFMRTDYSVAQEGYEYLINRGNANGFAGMGFMYQKGLGVPKDEIKARLYLGKAAEKGHVAASDALKKMAQLDSKQPAEKLVAASATKPVRGEKQENSKTAENRLSELKSLFHKGLISKSQYDQKREEILKAL